MPCGVNKPFAIKYTICARLVRAGSYIKHSVCGLPWPQVELVWPGCDLLADNLNRSNVLHPQCVNDRFSVVQQKLSSVHFERINLMLPVGRIGQN